MTAARQKEQLLPVHADAVVDGGEQLLRAFVEGRGRDEDAAAPVARADHAVKLADFLFGHLNTAPALGLDQDTFAEAEPVGDLQDAVNAAVGAAARSRREAESVREVAAWRALPAA